MDLFLCPVGRAEEKVENLMGMWKADKRSETLATLKRAIDEYVSLITSRA